MKKRLRNERGRAASTSDSNPGPAHGHWRVAAIAAGIVILAFLFRLYHLGLQELWLDEAVSFHITVLESGLEDVLLNQNTPPLYYMLLRAWVDIAGHSEAMMRIPSMVFGTLSVVTIIWLASMIFNSSVGLWSGLFAAINPLHIYYSQEARAYALLVFLVILSYALLWRALQRNRWRAWAGFAVCALLALYSHYMAILSLLPTAFLLLVWQGPGPKATRWRPYAVAMLGAAALFAPWAVLRFSLYSVSGVNWIREAWDYAGLFAIPQSLEVLGLGSERGLTFIHLKQYAGFVFPLGLRSLGLSILFVLAMSFVVPWGDKALGIPWIEMRKAWLVVCLLFPLGVLWVVSFFRPTYVVGRYDMTAFAPYPIILGFGIAKIGNSRRGGQLLAPILAMLLAGVVGAKLVAYFNTGGTSTNARAIADLVDRNVENGDVVVFTGLSAAPIIYYLYRRGYKWESGTCESHSRALSFGCRTFPRETEGNVGVYEPARVLSAKEELKADIRSFTEQLEGTDSRLWIVLDTFESSQELDYILPRAEASMIAELRASGFQPVFAEGRVLVFAQ